MRRIVNIDTNTHVPTAQALESTRSLLAANLPPEHVPRVKLVCGCHAVVLAGLAPESQKLVAFNLGYLPGANIKSQCTQEATTLAAIRSALAAVARKGAVIVMTYTGHPEGSEEHEGVLALASALEPEEWVVALHRVLNRPSAPQLVVMFRRPKREKKGR